jgi:lipopolysaccharide export system protein LptA
MTALRRLALAALALAILMVAARAAEVPVEITAGDGLEWRRTEKMLHAAGGVILTRGTMKLEADSLSAWYRDGGSAKKQEVYRVDATGNVRLTSDGAKGFGDSAAYDLDQDVFVLSGSKPRFEAEKLTVTATQNLEYWQAKRLAVARGGAVAQSGDRKIQADVISAYVSTGQDGNTELRRAEAIGKVRIKTPEDSAKGEEAVYVAETGIATLCGGVEIRRGANVLKGKCAEVNLNTGVSRLISGGGSVKGLVRQPDQTVPE